jgi:anti-sigma B factor antagonist
MAMRAVLRATPGSGDGFVASTEQLGSETPVVSVTGEVDLATVGGLERTLHRAAEDRIGEVIVDLTRCSFFDAGGLRALVDTRARLAHSNRALALVLSTPAVLQIFEITGLDKRFAIYPSLAEAMDAVDAAHV